MKISELFDLKRTQHELDFVDVDIDSDTPLFLDPYYIAKSDFPLAYEAHLSLKSFFECLLRSLREKRIPEAEEMFRHLGESNEICLGFSRNKPQGKGMGPSDASKILKSLMESPALRTGIMEDIEDFRIFVKNVDKDKMSDMTANIIKKQLIEYTQNQCTLWGIGLTSDTPSGFYWDCATGSWKNTYTNMLIVNGRKILLVPKRIVSYSNQYTPQRYMQHFVLNFLQNEQLQLNGPLVQHRHDRARTPFVTKDSIRRHLNLGYSIDKDWLANFTERHPKVFNDFRQKARLSIPPVLNEDLTTEPIHTVCSFLIEKLKAIPSGNDCATDYHQTIFSILELLFYPQLCNPQIEKEIHEGRKRVDIMFDNCADAGFFFRLCNTHGIPSRFIMVECKNYSRDLANPELDQIGGRFSPNRGQTGIIACRAVDDMSKLIKRCSDTYNDSRGLIIPLVDEDFFVLLRFKSEKNDEAIDNFIQKRFHDVASR